ncbi:hypothetical protein [Bradyrhizobium sp. CCBAU 51627]|uniref:hypothetical protein n=1 Tax=Bradyrhizobium sp. CCBAU 51627 TaxID=1325088 RepID=UPI002304D49B|nr:hypothetical protein [Bradyrhizobium sp. CCBAU 51627]
MIGASRQLGSRGGGYRPLEFIMKRFRTITAAAGLLLACAEAQAAQTNVAVAANFTDAAKEIAAVFRQKMGHESRSTCQHRCKKIPSHLHALSSGSRNLASEWASRTKVELPH